MKKQIFAVFLCVLMLFTLTACKNQEDLAKEAIRADVYNEIWSTYFVNYGFQSIDVKIQSFSVTKKSENTYEVSGKYSAAGNGRFEGVYTVTFDDSGKALAKKEELQLYT